MLFYERADNRDARGIIDFFRFHATVVFPGVNPKFDGWHDIRYTSLNLSSVNPDLISCLRS